MKVGFKSSFVKDLKRIKAKQLQGQVISVISEVEKAVDISDVKNVKRLRGGGAHYRIRLGDYRVGLKLENDTLFFVRFLHRKDIYRSFP